ncbi:MAG: hypothetical protein HC887_12035 [Desulfobacteraceae bacterium]|nr:hypothetical protein [Desulfobacteraceae bacterium]
MKTMCEPWGKNCMNNRMNIRQIDTQRMEIREGGGCLSLFGLPFFAAGIFMLLASLKIIPFQNADEIPTWSYTIIFFMAVAFTLVGGGLLFGRTWKTIDLNNGCILKVIGTIFSFLPSKQEEFHLHQFGVLAIRHIPEDSDTAESFPICLISKADSPEFLLCSASEYGEALKHAEMLADFLKFPSEDRTTDHKRSIGSGKIADSAERFKESRGKADVPMPMNLKSRITKHDGKTEIFIPGKKVTIMAAVPVAIILTLIVIYLPSVMEFFDRTHTPKIVQYSVIGFFLILILGINLVTLIYKLAGAGRNGTRMSITRGFDHS